MQGLAVGVAGLVCVEYGWLADGGVDVDGSGAGLAVHIDDRVVVGVAIVCDGPVHAGCEVVLEGRAPAPDGGLVGGVGLSVAARDRILRGDAGEEIAALRPHGVSFAVGLAVDIAASPTAPVGTETGVEAVVDEVEKGWRVAFHDEGEARVHLSEWALAADVGVEPLVGYG